MPDILHTIAEYAAKRVEDDKKREPLESCMRVARGIPTPTRGFRKALMGPELGFICEIKKASPSKGLIAPDFPYRDIAVEYEKGGADCVSCLTEPKWFLGSEQIFTEVRNLIDIPMIRKDFVIDKYQIYQSRIMGADCVLLICSLLDDRKISEYLDICDELGLDALVETHDEEEIRMAIRCGAKMIGVNNRNLKDFSVDFSNAERLRDRIPPEVVYVAESGVSSPEDVHRLKEIGADAVLIGEYLMRKNDKKTTLDVLRKA